MAAITFYTHPMSRGRTVRWMLEEIGAPYETRVLDYGPMMKEPAYRAINPMGKVPAIQHNGVVVTETAAICMYLADAFAEKGLAPALDDPARGTYYRWISFASGPLEQATTAKSMKWAAEGPRQRGMIGFGDIETTLAALETALAGPFILGDRFSAADCCVGSQIAWGIQSGAIDPRPSFAAYVARLAARPARQRAEAMDNALVASHPVPGMR